MKTVFIPIGKHCDVRYQIDKFTKKTEATLFFDWLRSDLICVNHLLKITDICKELLFKENLYIYDYDHLNSGVEFNTFRSFDNVLLSHHDLPVKSKLTDNDIEMFLDKYKRRFHRMMDIIRGNDMIYFIRSGDVNIYEMDEFIKNIQQIHPNCKFCLVSLSSENPDKEIKIFENENHFLKLNFVYFKIPHDKITEEHKKEQEWTRPFYYWKDIFSTILECAKIQM